MIIALLAGLCIPAIQSGLKVARNTACMSNLRQIGQAMGTYVADNDGAIPYDVWSKNAGGTDLTWTDLLVPYLGWPEAKNNDLFLRSTLGKRPYGVFACPESKAIVSGGSYSDYGDNYVMAGVPHDLTFPNQKLCQVRDAGKVFALGDAIDSSGGVKCTRAISVWGFNGSGLGGRHKNKANVMYYDFHVEAVNPADYASSSRYTTPWVPASQ